MQWSSRCLILGILGLSMTGCGPGAAPAPIVIGQVSDKSRRDKAGEQAELGLRLALHELLKDPALTEALDKRSMQIRHTDTRGNLDVFESEAVRLDSFNRAAALFGGITGPEVTALDHVKIPILTFHGTPVAGTGKNVFYLGMSSDAQGRTLGNTIGEIAKVKRVAILLDERRPESAISSAGFERVLGEAKANGVLVSTFRFGKEPKWLEQTGRIISHDADLVYFAGAVADFNEWMKSNRKDGLGDNVQIVFAGEDGAERGFDFDPQPKTAVYFVSAFSALQPTDKVAAFLKSYREAFQTEADVNSALAYDGLRMLADALKRSQPAQLTTERLRDEIAAIKDFDGLTGPLSVTSERQIERALFVMRWQNGVSTLVKKIAAPSEKAK